jgi:hypothetical protein
MIMESIIIKVPNKTDINLLLNISKRMGFKAETVDQKINKFIRSAPKNVPISDDDIMSEIYASRKNAKGKH